MRELLVFLAKALVDQPDRVEVEQFEEDDGTLVPAGQVRLGAVTFAQWMAR